jgi:hypothetical protein
VDFKLHHYPPPSFVDGAVLLRVRDSMKGQSEILIERAVLQARQEADLLFNLVVDANVAVAQNDAQREREYFFLWGYLRAEMAGKATEDRIRTLRSAVLMFVESVVVLDAAASQIAADSLRSQIDEEVASRFNLARLEMLSEFGPEAVMRTLLEQILRPPEQLGGIAPGRVKQAISGA